MSKPDLLLVEDDDILGTSLVQRLTLEGFSVRWARSVREAAAALRQKHPDVVVSDIRLPDGDGETLMRDHFESFGMIPIIFMTAYGEIAQAVELVRHGAWDYLSKPFDLDALIAKLAPVAAATSDEAGSFGHSEAMKPVMDVLTKAAQLDLPVTLLGETGTGKEVAARYLHEAGPRQDTPFVAVNAGSLESDTADSLLFGHERGAFTGANALHRGFVEEAGEGILFLDEIGELSPSMQVKLLRLIEQRRFRRLGGGNELEFKGRIVCATNRDLESMVADGSFRQDLWFRINVIICVLPPLRDRKEEITPLLLRRMKHAGARFGRTLPEISAEALKVASAYGWPGNVRELVNRVDRAMALTAGTVLEARDLFPDMGQATLGSDIEQSLALDAARERAEKEHILSALKVHGHRMKETADSLQISRTTLWEKMKRFGISSK